MVRTVKPRVLIADADPHLARLLCKFLSGHGYAGVAASHAGECLTKLRDLAPDLVVLDLALPRCEGDGVLSCLRGERHAALPRVVLTAPWSTHCLGRLIVPPVVGCLLRPFSRTGLLNAVRRALGECRDRGPGQRAAPAEPSPV